MMTENVHVARMAELTDPSKASQLFSSGSANAMSFGPESIFGATWWPWLDSFTT